jgi:hypothetical protein
MMFLLKLALVALLMNVAFECFLSYWFIMINPSTVSLCSHNTEKVVYFLLLDRKLRNPCKDDDEEIKAKSECG